MEGGGQPAQKSINAMMVTAPNATLDVSGGGRPKMAEGGKGGEEDGDVERAQIQWGEIE